MSETKPLTMSAEREEADRAIATLGLPGRDVLVACDAVRRAWAEIDALRQKLAEVERERDEARRLVVGTAMHGSKCAYCGALVKIEDMNNFDGIALQLRRHLAKCPKHPMRGVERSLAAAQLNARTLREALEAIAMKDSTDDPVRSCIWASETAFAALSAPADEAALREWGKRIALATMDDERIDYRGDDEDCPDNVAEQVVNAALGAPADEAALREIVTRVALYTLLNAHHDGAEIEHQTQACLAPLVERANAIVDRILGAPETHAKEG